MPKYAVMDIGTNAIKFHIAEKNPGEKWKTIHDRADVTRLGEGLNRTGKINPEAMERNISVIGEMIEIACQNDVNQIFAIGTMALRTATNANDFIDHIKNKFGISIEIISGDEEARLSFLAVDSSLDIRYGNFLIFDIGGGSTEFISGNDGKIQQKISFNIGVVRLTEDILTSDPVAQHECKAVNETIQNEFSAIAVMNPVDKLIGVGATLTTLGAMKMEMPDYDPDVIHGTKLSFTDVAGLLSLLQSKTIAERKRIIGLEPRRADVILAGAMIVWNIMKKINAAEVIISDRGVRHGFLIDRFGG
ncbi:Ppx/GppA family phosphatase [candidate division KSB1 bacterium]|nr:Ppx/GppA family phosphatase [candidate division KSB1 bacterium]